MASRRNSTNGDGNGSTISPISWCRSGARSIGPLRGNSQNSAIDSNICKMRLSDRENAGSGPQSKMGSVMQRSMRKAMYLLAVAALVGSAHAQSAGSVPDTIEGHLAAGKKAAGGRDNTPDFYGLVTGLCVAPQAAGPGL